MTDKTEQSKAISKNIIDLRNKFGWTQSKLAHEANISGAALSKIENSEGRIPTIVVLRKLASALKVQLNEITGEEPENSSATSDRNREFYRQWDVLDKLPKEDQEILKGMAERLRKNTE